MRHTETKIHTAHIPVLLHEVIDALALQKGATVLDATLGGGGHARALGACVGKTGTLICLDADGGALKRAEENLSRVPAKILLAKSNFRFAEKALKALGVQEVQGALMDLGFSSDQLASTAMHEGRGFSFEREEPLLMTFEDAPKKDAVTARDIVNYASPESIATMLFAYAEERHARKIATAILEARAEAPIETSATLARIIAEALPRKGKTHPATKTFQALRIAVNDELTALREGLFGIYELLGAGGTIAVISFHSIEDRIVKQTFRAWERLGKGSVMTKKPIVPGIEEMRKNPRARSAKLRVFKK